MNIGQAALLLVFYLGVLLFFVSIVHFLINRRSYTISDILAPLVSIIAVTTGWIYGRPLDDYISFGGAIPIMSFVVVMVAVILGMSARWFYYRRRGSDWWSLLRSLVVSPIVVLPLFPLFSDPAGLSPMANVGLFLVGFQNGFFWRVIFEDAKKKVIKDAN